MIAYAEDCLLALGFLASILSSGMAVCHYFCRSAGLRLLGHGAAFGVVIHALFGLLMATTWRMRPAIIGLLFLTIASAVGYLWNHGVVRGLSTELSRATKLFLGLWLLFIFLCIGIVHLPIRWPATLPDGQYVFKQHTLNVKIQVMTMLPADNYIAYVVSHYLLRQVPFENERPLLPACEISSRTILMSLAGLPLLALTDPPPKYHAALPRFEYVGKQWPDVMTFYDESSFRHFMIAGIILNSLLLLGLGVLFVKPADTALLPIAALLYVTNLYFVTQAIFTWPKAFAAFFIVLMWDSLARKENAKWTGLWAALAYNCHPYAVSFAMGAGLYYVYEFFRNRLPIRYVLTFAVVFGLLILPWLTWTHLILQIHSNLLTENLFRLADPAAHVSVLNFFWVRANTLFDLIMPAFFSVQPLDLRAVVSFATICVPGIVGLIVIWPAVREALILRNKPLVWFVAVLPGSLILIVFSYRAVAGVHGFQALVAVLLFLGLRRMQRTLKPWLLWSLVSLQLLLNLTVLFAAGYLAEIHLG